MVSNCSGIEIGSGEIGQEQGTPPILKGSGWSDDCQRSTGLASGCRRQSSLLFTQKMPLSSPCSRIDTLLEIKPKLNRTRLDRNRTWRFQLLSQQLIVAVAGRLTYWLGCLGFALCVLSTSTVYPGILVSYLFLFSSSPANGVLPATRSWQGWINNEEGESFVLPPCAIRYAEVTRAKDTALSG